MEIIRHFRELRLFYTGAFLAAGAYGWLSYLSLQQNDIALLPFFSIVLVATFACILAFISLSRQKQVSIWPVVIWAVVFRLLGLIGEPVLEDDFYRYLWDGYQFATTGTPYGVPPADFFDQEDPAEPFDEILGDINYPTVATIYGPSNQYLFLAAYGLKAGSVDALQLLMILVDLLLIWRLATLAQARFVLLYAWCPLVIKEIAFTAHPDGFGAALAFFAFEAFRHRAAWRAGIAMGLAVGAKIFAWLLVPFLLWRKNWRYAVAFTITVLALYLPFLLQGSSELSGLSVFAQYWEFNSAIFGVLKPVFGITPTKWVLAALFCLGLFIYWVWYCRNRHDEIPRADLIFALFLFIAPVINSWYFLWVLPFAVIYPSIWSWAASVALLLSYATGFNLNREDIDTFDIPWWVQLLEFGLISICVFIDVLWRKRLKSWFSANAGDAAESRPLSS